MSELPAGLEPAPEVRPRDSASVILLRSGPEGREVLLGVRSRRSRFMPGHWAFPGGVVDESDRAGDDDVFARCAVRELNEETGIEVDVQALQAAGERTTPPMFPVRFRTLFYLAEVSADTTDPEPPTDEIERLLFARPEAVIARWEAGECAVPPPVLPLLRTLVDSIDEPRESIVAALSTANAREDRAPRIEFAPDIWMLPVRTMTMPPATTTNVWMPGGERFVVIDPGSEEKREQKRLLEVIGRRVELGHSVDSVLLTHEHQDHVSGAKTLCEALDVPLAAHATTLASPRLDGISRTITLSDGDAIDLQGLILRAHHTPGHSPGHLAFELVDRAGLIAGDLISGISTILVEPRTGDMGSYLDSLERMHGLGCRMLFPGHGPPLPGKALGKLIEHRRQRETRVLEQVSLEGPELARIARAAYAELPELPQPLIELQTLAHLTDLERRGLVRRDGDERRWEQV